jgi:hypothetical protein
MAAGMDSVAVVERAELAGRQLDAESADWLRRLPARDDVRRQEARGELHARLLRNALALERLDRFMAVAGD